MTTRRWRPPLRRLWLAPLAVSVVPVCASHAPAALAPASPRAGSALQAVVPLQAAGALPQDSPEASRLCPAALSSRIAAPASLQPPVAIAASKAPRDSLPGYAAALGTTSLGWPRLDRWCIWLEPAADPAAPLQRRWQAALEAALGAWGRLLPLVRVKDPAAAQIQLLRRRPPLASEADGQRRASRGRALLRLLAVERRPGLWRLEPAVTVLIDPGQRAEAVQATALHELGHGLGLWGHSSDPADALAAVPAARPVLEPSPRDIATLRWLQAQPTAFGQPLQPPVALLIPAPPAARLTPAAPAAPPMLALPAAPLTSTPPSPPAP